MSRDVSGVTGTIPRLTNNKQRKPNRIMISVAKQNPVAGPTLLGLNPALKPEDLLKTYGVYYEKWRRPECPIT
jgi:hypothetical protein